MNHSRYTSSLRVGDAERDHVVELLNQHFAAGRLTPLEREERTAAALTARTAGDLDALLADLPELDPNPRPRARRLVGRVPQAVALVCVAALALFLALHLIPVFFAVGLFFLLTRRWRGSHRGMCRPHTHPGRW